MTTVIWQTGLSQNEVIEKVRGLSPYEPQMCPVCGTVFDDSQDVLIHTSEVCERLCRRKGLGPYFKERGF